MDVSMPISAVSIQPIGPPDPTSTTHTNAHTQDAPLLRYEQSHSAPVPFIPSTLSLSPVLSLCMDVYDTFPREKMTCESHMEQFERQHLLQLPAPITALVREVFFSLNRLYPVLKLAVDGLFESHSSVISRKDRTLCLILTVLILEKLPLISFRGFAALIRTLPLSRMTACLVLLRFFFEEVEARAWLKDQWCLIYDRTHVENVLLTTLTRYEKNASALIVSLSASLESVEKRKDDKLTASSAYKTTTFSPFNLSQSKPKSLPIPFSISSKIIAHPIPQSLFKTSLKKLEEARKFRRKAIEKQLKESHSKDVPPKLQACMRPTTLEKITAEEKEKERERTRQLSFARKMPEFPAPVRSKNTAAMILREEEWYRRQREDEEARLAKFEQELHDSSVFEQWQDAARKEDQMKKREEIETRKNEITKAALNAQASVAIMIEDKHAHALVARERSDKRNAMKEEECKAELKAKGLSAKLIATEMEKARQSAIDELSKQKKALALSVAFESKELARIKAEREATELLEKKAIMKEIQAMEALAAARAKEAKVVEIAVGSGLPLLEEMSFIEMKERLRLLEEREAAELSKKREIIREEKSAKELILIKMEKRHERAHTERKRRADQHRKTLKDNAKVEKERLEKMLSEEQANYQQMKESKRQRQIAAALRLAQERIEHSKELAKRLEAREALLLQHELDQQKTQARIQVERDVKEKVNAECELKVKREQKHNHEVYDQMLQTQHKTLIGALDEASSSKKVIVEQLNKEFDQVKHEQTNALHLQILDIHHRVSSLNPYAQNISNEHIQKAREEGVRRIEIERRSREREIWELREQDGICVSSPRLFKAAVGSPDSFGEESKEQLLVS